MAACPLCGEATTETRLRNAAFLDVDLVCWQTISSHNDEIVAWRLPMRKCPMRLRCPVLCNILTSYASVMQAAAMACWCRHLELHSQLVLASKRASSAPTVFQVAE